MKRDYGKVLLDMCLMKDEGKDYIFETLRNCDIKYETHLSRKIAVYIFELIENSKTAETDFERKLYEEKLKSAIAAINKLPRLHIFKDAKAISTNHYTFKYVIKNNLLVVRPVTQNYYNLLCEVVLKNPDNLKK